MTWERALTLGATYRSEGRCRFRVWAPRARQVEVRLLGARERVEPLAPGARGYFEATLEGVPPGSLYLYRLDGERDLPDPASRSQPDGVHGPSEVVDPSAFAWTDEAWANPPLEAYVLYELHVGTFTDEGTFEAIVPRLGDLRELGVTAVELMPVAQFPGGRNWGYDGVFPFAPQSTYGGPEGLRRLVDACHRAGIAVVLDVVYNHLGPEGNYLGAYGPYFTDRYKTPWGAAMNVDGPGSDEVRRYFVENACYWLEEFHVDAFRLDAIHAIVDQSAQPFLAELTETVRRRAAALGRRCHVIAESDLNDPRVIYPRALNGLGFDAQWADDVHHALESQLIGERSPYWADFGSFDSLARALRQGFVYTGQYSPRRGRRFGAPPRLAEPRQFVAFIQNHDQTGNRAAGERLGHFVSLDERKLAAGALLLSPFVPLLFMGEEYGEPHPFLYFTSHTDPDLVEAVRRGRKEEFAHHGWQGEPPDPQAEETFQRSKLQWGLREQGEHAALLGWYRELLRLRRALSALAALSFDQMEVFPREAERLLLVHRWSGDHHVLIALSFAREDRAVALTLPDGRWEKRLDAADRRWGGPGARAPETLVARPELQLTLRPRDCLLYERVDGDPPTMP